MDEDDEEWDMAAIDELEKKAQEANAARRASQAYPPSSTLLAPPANHFSNASNILAQPQKLQDILLEKEGAISLLRSRLNQAEQEVYELRRRLSTQASVWPTTQQQREIEHLSSQLLFKDQEIMEVKRICAEKEEQVKSAMHTAAALKQDVETLKRRREAFENKPCQERELELAEDSWKSKEPLSGCTPEKPHATQDAHRGRNSSKDLDNQWVTPWLSQNVDKTTSSMRMQKPLKDLISDKSVSISLSERNCSDLGLGSSKISSHLEPLEPLILNEKSDMRLFANGGRAEKSCNKVEVHGLVLDSTIIHNDKKPAVLGVHINPGHSSGHFSGIDEGANYIAHRINMIWKSKDAKDAGSDLVAKVFANCQPQLHMLFKFDDSQNLLEERSHGEEAEANEKKTFHEHVVVDDGTQVSLKFCSSLASVANGLASTVTLLGPLIEFCNCPDNDELVRSSMYIISCIVQHDHSCRDKLLGRPSVLQCLGMGNDSKNMNMEVEGSGWCIVENDKCSTDTSSKVGIQSLDGGSLFFSSQRIICRLKQVGEEAARSINGPNLMNGQPKHEAGVDKGLKGSETVAQGCADRACDSAFFSRWALQLAISSTSPAIRCETMTMMSCLLMHTEPLTERGKYASILFNEGLFSLLKKGAGALVQLQTIKLVHLLLHCPDTLNSVCQEKGTQNDLEIIANGEERGHLQADQKFVYLVATEQRQEGLDTIQYHSESRKGQVEATGHSIEFLEGLATCISFTGVSMQEYGLRRYAIRTLAFIAISGDTGVRFLLQSIPNIHSENGETAAKECQQGKQKKGPLSYSRRKGESTDPEKVNQASRSDGKFTDKHDLKNEMGTFQNIPYLLVTLIDAELSIEEEEPAVATMSERASLIQEALKLLCRLASHALHSSAVVALLTRDKSTLRTCVNVMNRLIRRGSQIDVSQNLQNPSTLVPDVEDLAKSLRRRMVAGATF